MSLPTTQNKRLLTAAIAFIMLTALFISSCESSLLSYYSMDKFTDEQLVLIKDAFDLTDQIDITLISLTEEHGISDCSFILVFTIKSSEWELFNEYLPSVLTTENSVWEDKEVVFDNSIYYLSREMTGGRNSRLKEYLSSNDTGIVLYSYRCFEYELDIHGMAKKYGTEVTTFPVYAG